MTSTATASVCKLASAGMREVHKIDITIHDVTRCLTNAGLRFQVKERYILTQCPLHQERNPSCQIFTSDWFCSCLAGCGRFPITRPFPELRHNNGGVFSATQRRPKIETVRTYKNFDLMEDWRGFPLIPREHHFKGLPLGVLDELGWRYDEAQASYFIPYFSVERDSIPFAQWRHLTGPRRFTFLAGARPTICGKWNISPGARLFIVEGTSDGAVLEHCGIPWVALPSASSGTILANFAKATAPMGVSLVYAGDNDQAGQALREALDSTSVPYRVCQPPSPYKDWGDMFQATSALAVFEHCKGKLFE